MTLERAFASVKCAHFMTDVRNLRAMKRIQIFSGL